MGDAQKCQSYNLKFYISPRRDLLPSNRLNGGFFLTLTDCPDCGCQPGELHELFCLKERCPFCGAQLAGCGCIKRVLQLSVDEQDLVDTYEDDSQEPLRGIIRKWERTLQRKGRIPYLR